MVSWFIVTPPFTLHAFTDANWAGDRDTFVSTTGFVVYLGRNALSWPASKKQQCVPRSSTEAEFWVVATTTTELLWLQSLLTELRLSLQTIPTIYCDVLLVFHLRMMHLTLAFHFVREQVHQNKLRIQHINGDDQLADALTKP